MKEIFAYTDYRKFLADYFEEQKRNSPHFSHRYFSQKAGFSTSNFLYLVINGKRNLTKESIFKIATAMKLAKKEMEYFENLVFYGQSKTIKEKGHYLEKLNTFRKSVIAKELTKDQFEFFSSWVHPVVREVACYTKGPITPRVVAEAVRPRITPNEAKKSLELLVRLGLLARTADGRFEQAAALMTTPPEVQSLAVANFHIQNMALAAEAIDRFKPQNRDISSVVLGITKENAKAIKKRIQELSLIHI